MVERAEQAQRLLGRQLFCKTCLLKLNAEALPQFVFVRPPFEAEHFHVSLVRLEQSLENLDRGGLACAVRPEKAEDLTPGHREVDGVHPLDAVVGLAQAANLDRRR